MSGRRVYVAEQGVYDSRDVVGVFDSPERAMAALHKPGWTWRKTTWTSFPHSPDRTTVHHWVTWENDKDWDSAISISEMELTESGGLRGPDEALVQVYRESDGGWDYVPESRR